jgi:hypothetical protein
MEIESCLQQATASKVVGTPYWDNSVIPSVTRLCRERATIESSSRKVELELLKLLSHSNGQYLG